MRLSLRSKLWLLVGTLLSTLVGSLIYVSVDMRDINALIDIQSQELDKLHTAQRAAKKFDELRYWLLDFALRPSVETAKVTRTCRIALDSILLDTNLDNVRSLDQIGPRIDAYTEKVEDAALAFIDEDFDSADSLFAITVLEASYIQQGFAAMLTDARNAANLAGAEVGASSRQLSNATRWIMIVSLLFGITCSSIFLRAIVKPLRSVITLVDRMNDELEQCTIAIERVANNDLTYRLKNFEPLNIEAESNDEIGFVIEAVKKSLKIKDKIATALNKMSENLHNIIGQMSSNATKFASSAREATNASKNASETAAIGGQIVSDTVERMQIIASEVDESAKSIAKLAQSTDEVGEIISVIDNIARQTNMLALNAAVEAARAGEHGLGFAVVADEVRQLALRTGKATSKIADMIKGIQTETKEVERSMETGMQEVNKGRELADKAGGSLKEVVNMSQQVMDMIQQIAAAAEEQSIFAEQITQNGKKTSTVIRKTVTRTENGRVQEMVSRL